MKEHTMETIIGNLLRTGVIASAAAVFTGGIMYLAARGGATANYKVFKNIDPALSNIKGIFAGAISMKPEGLIQLGLLLLIATPIARVAFSIFAFAKAKDRLYTIVTLLVFLVLMYSLFVR